MDKSAKAICVAIAILIGVLAVGTLCALALSTREYLIWAANRSRAEAEIAKIIHDGEVDRNRQQELLAEQKKLADQELESLQEIKKQVQADIDKSRQQLSGIEQRIAEQEANLKDSEKIRQQLDALKSELAGQRQEHQQLQAAIDVQKESIAKQEAQKLLLSGQINDLNSQISESRKEQSRQKQEADNARERFQSLRKTLAETEQEIAKREAELKSSEETRQKLALLREEYNSLLQLLQQTQGSLVKLKEDVAREDAQKTLISGQIKELEAKINQLRQEHQVQLREISAGQSQIAAVTAARQELHNLNEQAKLLHEKQTALNAELAKLADEKIKAVENSTALLQKTSAAQAEHRVWVQRMIVLKDEIEQLKKQKSDLNVENATLSKQNESLKQEVGEINLSIENEQKRQAALREANSKIINERDRIDAEIKEIIVSKRELQTEILRLYDQRKSAMDTIADLNKLRATLQKQLNDEGAGK